jgi:hypothetical protein
MPTPAPGLLCWLLLAPGLAPLALPALENAGASAPAIPQGDGVRLLTPARAGDLELALAVPAEARRVAVFYGTNRWWLVRCAHRERDAFRTTIYGYQAPELAVRTLWEDEAGAIHDGATARFALGGGDAAWARASMDATGCPVGFNLIPATGSEFPENLRTVAELGAHGVHDLLLNFYAAHYQGMLGNGQLDELLGACDRAGAQVWINTRDTDPLSDRYYPEAGLMSAAEAERFAFTYTLVRDHRIDGDEVVGDSGDAADQWWLPHWSAEDVLAVSACVYDPASADPLPGAIELPAAAVEWHYAADPRRPHRPTITYRLHGCAAWAGRAATVRIALRTLRVWTLPPLWDDAYYDGFYRPRMIGDLVRLGRLAEHRSFRGFAAINEPTISWQGGELWHPAIQARWTAFLRGRFPDLDDLNRAFASAYRDHGAVPYLQRLVYRGEVHTSWSGRPGQPGLGRAYELAKDDFREELVDLVYQRAIAADRAGAPGGDAFIKFQKPGASSYYGLELQAGDQGVHTPGLTAMATDFYPIGHLEKTAPQPPLAVAPLYLADASYGALLARGAGLPCWVAETSFGRARDQAAATAATTRTALDLLFSAGVSRAFVWAIVPSGWRADQDPYGTGGASWSERTSPAFAELAAFVARNAQRAIRQPDYDLVVLVPRTDARLWGAGKDHYLTGTVCDLSHALIERGFLVAEGALTRAACAQAKAVVLPGGFYLAPEERALLRSLDVPLLVLAPPYPVDPLDGVVRRDRAGAVLASSQGRRLALPGGGTVALDRTVAVTMPAGAQLLLAEQLDGLGAVATAFSVGTRTTVCAQPASAPDAARLVDWWFRRSRAQPAP